MELTQDEVDFIINHLFLPPKLPQDDDREVWLEYALLRLVAGATATFAHVVPQEQQLAVRLVAEAISKLIASRDENGAVSFDKLSQAFQSLVTEPTGTMIPLHINKQNAGIIFSNTGSGVVFEAFELSPLNEAVMSTQGRLRRSFPGPAVTIPTEVFDDPELQSTLAKTLSTMSVQPGIGMIPTVRKSRNEVQETRDTTHPGLVTELLLSFLGPFSSHLNVQRICKNTCEEVLWKDARFPWRRSPLWLLVRVMAQLQFTRSHANTATQGLGIHSYKLFIIHILATVLDQYLKNESKVDTDKLDCMIAKLVRRMLKLDLGRHGEEPGISFAKGVLEKAKAYLEQRWTEIQSLTSGRLDLDRLKNLEFEKDATLDLPELDAFLSRIPSRKSASDGLEFTPTIELFNFPADTLPTTGFNTTPGYKIHSLHALEQWVSYHLTSWTREHISDTQTCHSIKLLVQGYHNEARSVYAGNPESWSIMLLTILELWAACDKSAVARFPLLADYDPGVPDGHLRFLLLPMKKQMARLRELELYLKTRRQRARYGESGSIISDFGTGSSFGELFFDQSNYHQDLRRIIERDADLQRKRKREELARKKQSYNDHMHMYGVLTCDYVTRKNRWGDYVSEHSYCCKRCSYRSKANAIKIEVHEWPLPRCVHQLKSVVFELDPPAPFSEWRNVTMYLLLDVLGSEYTTEKHRGYEYSLAKCELLAPYYKGSNHRVCLLSDTKPHVVTHRNKVFSFPSVTEQDVCLNNGLHFRYFDTDFAKHLFTSPLAPTEAVLKQCTYNLPEASSAFRQFIYRRFSDEDSTPNHVIATQSECPAHFSLAEYRALASIPVGHRIGWENMLVQIRSPLFDFKKPEVSFVFFQTMYQAGPVEADNIYRAGHAILANNHFGRSLQHEIREASKRIEENWESLHALSVLVSASRRQLSLASSPALVRGGLGLLHDLRSIALSWMSSIQEKYQEAESNAHRAEFQHRIVEAALVCCGTFDVDDEHLQTILSGDDGQTQASIFIRCGILIHDTYSSKASKTHGNLVPILHRRWEKLSLRACPLLARLVLQEESQCCLDVSIKAYWPAYEAGDAWVSVRGGIDHWVSSTTNSRSRQSMRLHYNLLTGDLLVNGLPLSRLPLEYERHDTYTELFGKAVFKIIPSSSPGMRFCAQGLHQGHSVQFGFANSDLIVQATNDDRTFEVLPRSLFLNRLPQTFVDEYSHWYDAASNLVVFRKRRAPWKPDKSPWILSRDGARWKLDKQGLRLVSMTSSTGKTVASVFAPLQTQLHINIILAQDKRRLEIELPQLRHEFYLERDTSSVISRKLRGLKVDSNQSIGTLVGLRTKMVLKDPLSGDRKVLIPAGSVKVSRSHGHISVVIDPAQASPYVYKVDELLQRLTDNGDLQSKLFLCYLHGLSSFCLPDPLTCLTGTERALFILKSAAVKSYYLLTVENLDMLENIDSLTPRRQYYPPSESVMQSVQWHPHLPSLSQHPHFHVAIAEILQHYRSTELFHPEEYVSPPSIHGVNHFLLGRDSSRSSKYRISCFGAEDFLTASDRVYSARDNGQSTTRAREARIVATMLFRRDGILYRQPASHPNLGDHILHQLKQVGEVNGPSNLSPSLPALEYDSRWLEDLHPNYWAEIWNWLHMETRKRPETPVLGKFPVIMWFATMAFASKADLDMLHAAAAMFLLPAIQAIKPVERLSFTLSQNDFVNYNALRGAVSGAGLPFERSPEYLMDLPTIEGETRQARWERRQKLHHRNQDRALAQFIKHLIEQFPTPAPTWPVGGIQDHIRKYFDIAKGMAAVAPLFTTWHNNRLFTLYMQEFGKVMGVQVYQKLDVPTFGFEPPETWTTLQNYAITSADFFTSTPLELMTQRPRISAEKLIAERRVVVAQSHLETLVQRLECSPSSKYEHQYARELRESATELNSGSQCKDYKLGIDNSHLELVLEEYLSRSEQHMSRVFDRIVKTIRTGLEHRSFAEALLQSPRLSSVFLLQQLSKHGWAVGGGWNTLSPAWKTWIVRYGEAVAQVQRAKRLIQCFHNNKANDIVRELQSEGHTNWSPSQYPEALLLEIENNITIREVQADIAEKMMNPPGSRNAVMQLNMGEGKSSVIVPIVSAALADGSKLVRVIVAKPQSRQMFHMLMVTLGGLINRQIFHLPFSRAIRLTEWDATAIANQCRLCQETGGIMLLQPEHILSFKLMGLETRINGREAISQSLLQTQYMFNTNSRDIVDESDENFSVKFELIYPLGAQRSIDFAPNRWILIQTILDIVRDHTREVLDNLPNSIDVREGKFGSFPRIRMLKPDATRLMLSKVASYICTKGFPGFPISRQKLTTRQAVLRYICQLELSAKEIADVEEGAFWTESTASYLWLLRGLFAKGILAFVYGQKRWKVNYGLDKSRKPPTELAVPYRAKDSPTPRSEFSHPDAVIALTYNSYYYQGLTDDELFLAFEHLLESDQADADYDDWKRDACALPSAFRQLVGVNLQDVLQCKAQLFPSFRHGKRTIDYYLQHIVFPKHMKEFPKKLTASGWDLGAVGAHPITGFSGTIDSRKVLPLDVSYLDLREQKHTNARVLEYLLRPENGVVLLPREIAARTSDAEALLNVILAQNDQKLRVILDVGAQILEFTNAKVAQTWLDKAIEQDPSVQAAIYFDDKEELVVRDLKGAVGPLQTSPYIDQLDVCLVFLDEAHTRGTDLKLPVDYRAAVTIGPSLTKDRLVQACMRMRKLGKGQSVIFCIPTEVQHKIHELQTRHSIARSQTRAAADIGVLEVLEWSISETIVDLQRSMQLWAVQGERFDRQEAYWKESTTDEGIEMTNLQAERFLEDEAVTLKYRYNPHPRESIANESMQIGSSERRRAIRDRCLEVGAPQVDEAALQEEQERELSPEIEEERQIERPPSAKPAKHVVHDHLRGFVSSGSLPRESLAVMPAFTALRNTSAADFIDVNLFPKEILATVDFDRTICKNTTGRYLSDAYQRPVQWILTSQPKGWNTVIIISPYEANELLPDIRKSKHVTLHVYCARPNQEIEPLDRLTLFSAPSLPADWSSPFPLRLMVQLNLFAGQLYLKSPDEYAEVCRMLRLSREEASEGVELGPDGFIISANTGEAANIIRTSAFTKSPVKFLTMFLSRSRKDCQSIEKTHLGKILGGALLQDKDFDEENDERGRISISESCGGC